MRSLLETERATYEAIWDAPGYRDMSPGEQLVAAFKSMSGAQAGDTVLDAGCGSGKGALALQAAGFAVTLCDLTDAGLVDDAKALPFKPACLWNDLKPQLGYQFGGAFDWIYCCDVLEHVPPTFAMLVIRRLLDSCRKGLFLSIALEPDNFGPWIGKPLHQTVMPFPVWRDQLATVGQLVEARDLLTTGLYFVRPC